MQTITEYHRQKQAREALEGRIVAGFIMIALFVICPAISYYL